LYKNVSNLQYYLYADKKKKVQDAVYTGTDSIKKLATTVLVTNKLKIKIDEKINFNGRGCRICICISSPKSKNRNQGNKNKNRARTSKGPCL
jgi:hypothetical protein